MATNPNVTNMLTGKIPVQAVKPTLPAKPQPLQRVFYRNPGDSTIYDNFGVKYSTPKQFFDAGGKWENVRVNQAPQLTGKAPVPSIQPQTVSLDSFKTAFEKNPIPSAQPVSKLQQIAEKAPSVIRAVTNPVGSLFGAAQEYVTKNPKKVLNFAKDILQGTATSGAVVGQGVFDIAKGMTQGKSPSQIASDVTAQKTTQFDPNSLLGKTASTLFGRTDLPSASQYGREVASVIPGGEDFAKRNPTAAFGLGLGLSVLDFTGAGESKGLIKKLASLNKTEDVIKTLRKIGVAEDVITDFAPVLAKTKNETEIAKIIGNLPPKFDTKAATAFEIADSYTPTAPNKQAFAKQQAIEKVKISKQQAIERVKTLYDNRVAKIKDAKQILSDRRTFIKAVQKQFGLTDNELKSITQRDIRLMDNLEFKKHLDNIRIKAEQVAERRQALNELNDTINTKELKKVENLQQALKLPKIKDMSSSQLRDLDSKLSQFKTGDEFLSVRKLETVDKTDLAGIKTLREAKERLAKELGRDVLELDNIKVGNLDRFMGSTTLASKNPFYKLMVDSTNSAILNAEARFLKVEDKINKLINKARKSKGLSERIIGKLVPQDKNIFKWLSGEKVDLTNEEMEAVQYIKQQYAEMRDYLAKSGVMKNFKQDYITHINRGFLEELKDGGVRSAFKNLFKIYQNEEAAFNIIDDTGKILPLEKFFQYSMKRSGKLEPTQNVAKAFLSYLKAFEKKVALDSIIPKLDIYSQSLTPKIMTPHGLEFDRSLKTFVNEWLNTQKGRTAKIVGVEQGGKVDLILRAGNSLVSLLDLGLNIPVGIAARGGENMTNFIQMGTKKYALGLARARTSQGKKIAENYKNFIGRTPFDELKNATKSLPEKTIGAMFGLFQDATARANKTFLLGSLSPEEWRSGVVSADRLAEIRREMGRYRMVEGATSIVGATSPGKVLTKYKGWALPIIRATAQNLNDIAKNPKLLKERQGQELLRGALGTLAVVFTVKAFVGEDKNDSFVGTIVNKAYSDAMSLIGALDPKTITSEPRLISFIGDLGESLSNIVKGEGFKKAVSTFTPRMIKQFIPKEESKLLKNKLNTEEKAIFDKIKTSSPEEAKQILLESAQRNEESTKRILEAFTEDKMGVTEEDKKMQGLGVKDGKRAQAVWEKIANLPKEEQKKKLVEYAEKKILTEDVLKQVIEFKTGNRQPTFENNEEAPKQGILKTVTTYAKAIGTDPVTAFNRIFTGQRIRRLDNGTIIVERMPLTESQKVKADRGAGETMILDHTIPLQLGGSNSGGNLNLVEQSIWATYTPVENKLGKLLRDKKITKKEAQNLIKDFKEGKISAEEIMNR